MGWIEDLDRATGTHYRAVPWFAGPPGVSGKRGPSRVFKPGEYRLAEKYIIATERRDDGDWAEFAAPVHRNRRRVRFADYVVQVAATMGEQCAVSCGSGIFSPRRSTAPESPGSRSPSSTTSVRCPRRMATELE